MEKHASTAMDDQPNRCVLEFGRKEGRKVFQDGDERVSRELHIVARGYLGLLMDVRIVVWRLVVRMR